MTITSKDWVKIVVAIIIVVCVLGLIGFSIEYLSAQQTAKELDKIFATPQPSVINRGTTDTPTWTASKELGPEGKLYNETTGEEITSYYNSTITLKYAGPPIVGTSIYYVYNTDPNNWDSELIWSRRGILEEGFTLTYHGSEFLIDGAVTNSTFQIKWTTGEVFIEV